MKVELTVKNAGRPGSESHEVLVDGKSVARIASLLECPSYACIGRGLIDGSDVLGFIRMGYDAAKRGEELDVTIK